MCHVSGPTHSPLEPFWAVIVTRGDDVWFSKHPCISMVAWMALTAFEGADMTWDGLGREYRIQWQRLNPLGLSAFPLPSSAFPSLQETSLPPGRDLYSPLVL